MTTSRRGWNGKHREYERRFPRWRAHLEKARNWVGWKSGWYWLKWKARTVLFHLTHKRVGR